MAIITVLLVAIFFAAWKAPRWIKEIGLLALAVGFLGLFLGMYQAFSFIAHEAPDIAAHIVYGGVSVALIAPTYGIIVYMISLVVRMIKKPRI